jgi:hypothetical protein
MVVSKAACRRAKLSAAAVTNHPQPPTLWHAPFCRAFDEIRNFLRPTSTINQNVSLACRRVIHLQRVAALRDLISAA